VTIDYGVGQVTFASSQTPPVFLTGRSYDVYGAAADLLERRAVAAVERYTFTSDGQTFNRSAILTGYQAEVARLRALARPRALLIGRSDVPC
jgi:hypothetical protein